MAAQAHFSPRELHGRSAVELQELLFGRGINWNDYPARFKRGGAVVLERVVAPGTYTDKRWGQVMTAPEVERRVWRAVAPPIFTQDREWLRSRIPRPDWA